MPIRALNSALRIFCGGALSSSPVRAPVGELQGAIFSANNRFRKTAIRAIDLSSASQNSPDAQCGDEDGAKGHNPMEQGIAVGFFI